jgi:hypothetical protein
MSPLLRVFIFVHIFSLTKKLLPIMRQQELISLRPSKGVRVIFPRWILPVGKPSGKFTLTPAVLTYIMRQKELISLRPSNGVRVIFPIWVLPVEKPSGKFTLTPAVLALA